MDSKRAIRILEPDALERLQAMLADRDRLVQMLGIATMEWRARMAVLEASIDRSQREQRAFGESLLAAMGLDAAQGEYQIDQTTGIIRQLVGGTSDSILTGTGAWVEVLD